MEKVKANCGDKENLFACNCGEENQKEMADLMEWTYKNLGSVDNPTTDENFLDRVIHNLSWRYGANIDGIYTDQWSMISTKASDYEGYTTPGRSVVVECDRVAHGLALTLKTLHEHYGGPRKYKDDDED